MTKEKLLSALDIAEELNIGKATIKFLLKRFKKWLPYELISGMPYYLPQSIGIIIKILEQLETGMLPGEIDKSFDTQLCSDRTHIPNSSINLLQNEDIHINKEGVALLKSLFCELGEQQKRIALAHEKRAAAEERKAVAIEKRAEAEEKKAEAMNNIANALQDMNRFRDRGIEPAIQKTVHEVAKALVLDQTDPTYEDIRMNDISETDDLSLLIKDEFLEEQNPSIILDDLSALLEDDLKATEIEIDDLSVLLDQDSLETVITEGLDDLSQLIDGSDKIKSITKETIFLNPYEPMDDLRKLITPSDSLMDDLSVLIDSAETVNKAFFEEETIKKTKAISIDISPDDDIDKYKASIMKIILELKTEGFNAEETTILLNNNKIQTLSGKPEWSQKAISQIYKFMTSVK